MPGRLRISPGASVVSLMDVLEKWMDLRGSRDLVGLLSPLEEAHGWGRAPKTGLLADFHDLAVMLLQKALVVGKRGSWLGSDTPGRWGQGRAGRAASALAARGSEHHLVAQGRCTSSTRSSCCASLRVLAQLGLGLQFGERRPAFSHEQAARHEEVFEVHDERHVQGAGGWAGGGVAGNSTNHKTM